MKWSDIADVVGKAAPLIGSVIGGPAGAGVGAMVASALGVENTPEAVQAALGNPDNLVKLKEIESNERKHLLDVQLEHLRIEASDRQNARTTHKDSVMPALVTVTLMLICSAGLGAMFFVEIPATNKDIVIQSIGSLLSLLAAAVAFWVGTTKSSQDKTKIIGGMQ